ncbi:Aldehyde_dehydrogenase [Hexamita inflata]|uniref:Aldehyde dehydrogenase n=1 Tax=Hexamita inflata TaxID=28002 RepID=A0AA86PZI8_9EUKA|nr:Aldehyde dehydrogenase [Hexamita inflata]
MSYEQIFNEIKKTHESKVMYSIQYRISLLKDFQKAIKENEQLILDALWEDRHKSKAQAKLTELTGVYHELNYFISNLKNLAKPRYEKSSMQTINAKVYTQAFPMGPTLIVTPFNYPVNLSLIPLIGSIASGNPVVLKYSKSTPAVQRAVTQILLLAKIPTSVVSIYTFETSMLFNVTYSLVIFTGSTQTGKSVFSSCSKTLTKCILELGGANPCVVFEDADLENAAQQVAILKFTNSGQTCITCNYLSFIGSEQKFQKFQELLTKYMSRYVNNYEHVVKIDGKAKYDELTQLSKHSLVQVFNDKVIFDNESEKAERIAKQRDSELFPPTLLQVKGDEEFVTKEIFGPVLPMFRMESMQEFKNWFNSRYSEQAKPLSSYLFTKNKQNKKEFKQLIQAGAININQGLLYVNSSLPFGGVGESGLGSYHGIYSFNAFSHMQPVFEIKPGKTPIMISKALAKLQLVPYSLQFGDAMMNMSSHQCNINWVTVLGVLCTLILAWAIAVTVVLSKK